jgi:multiple sugar transport system ATP-binding protein
VKVQAGGGVQAKVDLVERLGDRTLVYAHLNDGQAITGEDIGTSTVQMGDTVNLRIDGGSAHIFGPDGTGYHAEARGE